MIGPMLPPVAFLFVLGAILMWHGSRSVSPVVRRQRWVKYVTYAALVWMVIGLAALGDHRPLRIAMGLIAVSGTYELVRACWRLPWRFQVMALMVHGMLCTGLVSLPMLSVDGYADLVFTLVFIVTCTFDAFSQVTGQIWGSRQLAPRLSPGKTIAGALGGLIVASGFSLYLMNWHVWNGIELGVSVSIAAFAGDLFYSWVKRRCGIKDFGTLLPGHGGVLDRFDSLLAASSAFMLLSLLD